MSVSPTVYGKYYTRDEKGNWIAKDEDSKKHINDAIKSFLNMYGNIANMSIKERTGLNFSDDAAALFNSSQSLKEAELYKIK